jgi:hypothetical protein
MWNRFFVSGLATSVLMLSAVAGASAEGLNIDHWTAFAQQQPLLSRVFVTHQAAAVAQFFDMSPDQLRAELADRSLAEMAASRNRSSSDVAAVMVDSANRDLQLATTLGLISHESSADLKAQFEAVLPGLISVPSPPVIAFG